MRISLLISILCLVFAIALNAQTNNHRHSKNQFLWGDIPDAADGIFTFSYGKNQKDTTLELIDCPAESGEHRHQMIDIFWENGIPRHGIITACSKKQQNVSYFPADFNPPKGEATPLQISPRVMHNYMELYIKQPVTVVIMDVLTGEIVHTSLENPTGLRTYSIQFDSIAFSEQGYFTTNTMEIPAENYQQKVNYPPKVVNYSHLENGLYFMVVLDNSSKEILFLKTFRKGQP